MDLMIESFPRLLNATKLTIELTLLSLFFGILVGVFFAILRTSKNKIFFEDKIETPNLFFNRVLPRIDSHYKSAISGSKYIMDFKFN